MIGPNFGEMLSGVLARWKAATSQEALTRAALETARTEFSSYNTDVSSAWRRRGKWRLPRKEKKEAKRKGILRVRVTAPLPPIEYVTVSGVILP